MVREDLITSAVSFLQDPSVASAPVEKRIAFLQSKNLTQEEIDLSLARAAEYHSRSSGPSPSSAPPNYAYRSPQSAAAYPPQGYWQPLPPPELPKRDWRDYFIMATVMGGVGYGLYFTAKRYILPLIQPPTQPQLEQDKASIDESFKRAFDLLEQLNTDTSALKSSEEARTQRLDKALTEVESVLEDMKESSKRQNDDNRRIEDDVRGLRDLIPKALDSQRESTDNRLRDLSTELKSLRTLMGNRMSSRNAQSSMSSPSYSMTQSQAPTPFLNAESSSSASELGTQASQQVNGVSTNISSISPSANNTERPASSYGRIPGGRAAIPAWQMAAQKVEKTKETSESGTAVEGSP